MANIILAHFLQQLVEVARQIRKIQMAMRVNEHGYGTFEQVFPANHLRYRPQTGLMQAYDERGSLVYDAEECNAWGRGYCPSANQPWLAYAST
jgi:hypothetical protein